MCAQHQVSLIKLGVIREDAVDDLLRAAKTTFAENSPERGIPFLETCLKLPGLQQRGDVHRMLGEMYLGIHRLSDSETQFLAALQLIEEPMSKARIWSLMSQLAGSRYQTAYARQCLEKAYKELNIAAPTGDRKEIVKAGLRWLWLLATGAFWKEREAQGEERGRHRLLGELLERSTTLAYYQFDQKIMSEAALGTSS